MDIHDSDTDRQYLISASTRKFIEACIIILWVAAIIFYLIFFYAATHYLVNVFTVTIGMASTLTICLYLSTPLQEVYTPICATISAAGLVLWLVAGLVDLPRPFANYIVVTEKNSAGQLYRQEVWTRSHKNIEWAESGDMVSYDDTRSTFSGYTYSPRIAFTRGLGLGDTGPSPYSWHSAFIYAVRTICELFALLLLIFTLPILAYQYRVTSQAIHKKNRLAKTLATLEVTQRHQPDEEVEALMPGTYGILIAAFIIGLAPTIGI